MFRIDGLFQPGIVVILFAVIAPLLANVVIGVATHVCLSVLFWFNHVMTLAVLRVSLSSSCRLSYIL